MGIIEEKDPENEPKKSQGLIPNEIPDVELIIDKDYFHGTLFFLSGIRIPVNWVEKELIELMRANVAKDLVIHGKDFSVNMRKVCFMEIHRAYSDD